MECTLLVGDRRMFGGTMVSCLDFMDFADVSERADPRQLQLHLLSPNHDSFDLHTNYFRSLVIDVHPQKEMTGVF